MPFFCPLFPKAQNYNIRTLLLKLQIKSEIWILTKDDNGYLQEEVAREKG